MKKGKSVRIGIVVALLLLVVGFAAVSASLDFSGTAKLKGNEKEFNKNLRFVADTDVAKHATITSSTDKTGGSVKVSEDGKTLTFTTPVLDLVGETVTVTYWLENRGQYKAEVGAISCKLAEGEDETIADYLEVTPNQEYKDYVLDAGSDTTPAQANKSASVVVKLKKTYASEEEASVTYTCTLAASAQENNN